MGFRFTLESVLRFREGLEKREELTLQKIQDEVAQVRSRIDELTEEISKANLRRDDAMRMWMQASELKNLQDELTAAVNAREALLIELEGLKEKRDAQMKVYQAARVNRRMLTDMEKQKREEWVQEQARKEQKRLDDIFSSRLQRG
jgi:flagellar export protein FliJ